MDNQIDQVIAELSKIDAAASKVISDSEADKIEYEQQINNKIKDFDRQLDLSVKKELEEFEKKLMSEKDMELTKLRENTTKALADMDSWYEKNHEQTVKMIIKDLTKE